MIQDATLENSVSITIESDEKELHVSLSVENPLTRDKFVLALERMEQQIADQLNGRNVTQAYLALQVFLEPIEAK